MTPTKLLRLCMVLAASCALPTWAAAQVVTSFTVVNADTGADIATFTSSGTVSIAATPNINVRANASSVKSVVFTDLSSTKTENAAPYAYKGDSSGVYKKWAAAAGVHVINAKPFSGPSGTGTAGTVATLNLTITGAVVPPPGPTQLFTLAYQSAPADNPLKGFMPYQGHYSFAHSLEWFYVPLKALQTGFTSFNWTALDARLSAIAARGHQAVFRVYMDYPNSEYGVPDFLSGVPKHSYTDNGNGKNATSYSPDYGNADLQLAVLNFVSALGARYDNDPRVAFISAGLLGFWGEWHTYPHNTWMATPGFMNQVVDAYERAFPNKLILAREPKSGVNMNRARLGFHDDSFAYETLGPAGWHFWPKMTAAGLQDSWKNRPIGGEVRPEVQGCVWDDKPCTPAGQDFATSVATTHASWMLNQGAFTAALSATKLQRATEGARSLGYALHVPKATLQAAKAGQALQGTVTLENRGVAPFYYPWTVQMGALDSSGRLSPWSMTWDLRTVAPGAPVTWIYNVPQPGLAAGTYTLLIGVMNPMQNGHPLRFANTTQDQHRSGWLSLGAFTVNP